MLIAEQTFPFSVIFFLLYVALNLDVVNEEGILQNLSRADRNTVASSVLENRKEYILVELESEFHRISFGIYYYFYQSNTISQARIVLYKTLLFIQ